MSQNENHVRSILNLIQNAERDLHKAKTILNSLVKEKSDFEDVPGTLGVFDGIYMVAPDGKKYEVNPNYAAKSMLVTGDNLKMIEEDGKQLFKQISKVNRKKLAGILNKKEGIWYALTDVGSYRLPDVAVEFRRGQINDEVFVLVPESNLHVEYAALEKLPKEDTRPIIDQDKADAYEASLKAKMNAENQSQNQGQSSNNVSSIATAASQNRPTAPTKTKEFTPVSETKEEKPRSKSPARRSPATSSGGRTDRPRNDRPSSGRSSASSSRAGSDRPSRPAPRKFDTPRVEESPIPNRADTVQSILEEDDLV